LGYLYIALSLSVAIDRDQESEISWLFFSFYNNPIGAWGYFPEKG
jgi:hypothetical protein